MRRDPLNIHDQSHQNETDNDHPNADQNRKRRAAVSATYPLTADSRSARRPKPSRFRRWLILQIGITVHRHFARRFEHVEIRRYIDIEKFSVHQKEPFGVSQTRKLRKIVGLD